MDFIAGIMKDLPAWALAISGVLTACTAITALTPTKVDDKLFGVLTKAVNVVLGMLNVGAGNVLKNENKDAKK